MRKILIFLIIVLLCILSISVATKGVEIGKIKISSIEQIHEQSNKLQNEIEEVNKLKDIEFANKKKDLFAASKNLDEAKKEYLKYTSVSSNDVILDAMQRKSYRIESLWVKLGTHARKEGVILEFRITPSVLGADKVQDIGFTVDGSYIAIMNFVYAIENDPDLSFKIENFRLVPNSGELLRASFDVRNISIEEDTLSQTKIAEEKKAEDKEKTNTENTGNTNTEKANTENTGNTNTEKTNTESTGNTNTEKANTENTGNTNTEKTNTENTGNTNTEKTNTENNTTENKTKEQANTKDNGKEEKTNKE